MASTSAQESQNHVIIISYHIYVYIHKHKNHTTWQNFMDVDSLEKFNVGEDAITELDIVTAVHFGACNTALYLA